MWRGDGKRKPRCGRKSRTGVEVVRLFLLGGGGSFFLFVELEEALVEEDVVPLDDFAHVGNIDAVLVVFRKYRGDIIGDSLGGFFMVDCRLSVFFLVDAFEYFL